MCFDCSIAWHHGLTCAQAIENDYKGYIKNYGVKFCPHCKVRIEKSDGCNLMNCLKCGNMFCWLCLKKYSRYHFERWNCCGCPGLQHNVGNRKRRCAKLLNLSSEYLKITVTIFLWFLASVLAILLLFLISILAGWFILYKTHDWFSGKIIITFLICNFSISFGCFIWILCRFKLNIRFYI